MKFIFFGTPEPAAEILGILHAKGLRPSLIVTNPDRPQGRNLKLTPSPVKEWAIAHEVPLAQPEEPSDAGFTERLRDEGADVFIVVAYGAILPKALLEIPRRGSLNVHYSLLPKYRGASPVESQILADDRDAGVSILLLDEKMDHGPIIAQRAIKFPISGFDGLTVPSQSRDNFQFLSLREISRRETNKFQNTNDQKEEKLNWPPKAEALRSTLNTVAGELLAEMLPDWVAGKMEAKPQDHTLATYTKKFTKADCEIDLSADPYGNYLKIQALGAWGPYFFIQKNGRKLRIGVKSAAYTDGKLNILRVVPEGKKEMNYEEFQRGLR